MKQILLRSVCIVLYCAVAVLVCGGNLPLVFNIREMLLVGMGTVLLTVSSLFSERLGHSSREQGKQRDAFNWRQIAMYATGNAIIVGILAAFISILSSGGNLMWQTLESVHSETISSADILGFVIPKIRPLLYGFMLFAILRQNRIVESSEMSTDRSITKNSTLGHETISARTEKTVTGSVISSGDTFRDVGLTRREAEIARMAASGLTNAEIAESLCISPVTVKTHLANIFQKTGFISRTELRQLL